MLIKRSISQSSAGRRTKADRQGATIVETALVLNLFLMFLFSTFDFARFVMMQQLASIASQEGARLASVNTSTMTTSGIQSFVTDLFAGQVPANLTILVYQANATTGANAGPWTNTPIGQLIAVEITGTYTPMVPGLNYLTGNVPIAAKSIVTSEAN